MFETPSPSEFWFQNEDFYAISYGEDLINAPKSPDSAPNQKGGIITLTSAAPVTFLMSPNTSSTWEKYDTGALSLPPVRKPSTDPEGSVIMAPDSPGTQNGTGKGSSSIGRPVIVCAQVHLGISTPSTSS